MNDKDHGGLRIAVLSFCSTDIDSTPGVRELRHRFCFGSMKIAVPYFFLTASRSKQLGEYRDFRFGPSRAITTFFKQNNRSVHRNI